MKIAIVTGASSGLGREFVIQLAKSYQCLEEIWVISRSRDKLEALQGAAVKKIVIIPLDLRKRSELKKLKQKLENERPSVKVLVNGAGLGMIGKFGRLPLDSGRQTIRLNCEALTMVTHLVLPYMKRNSRIMMMASAAAFIPQPDFAVYAASKAYVLSFSRALRQELKDSGITVTAVCPGPVDTPFFDKAEAFYQVSVIKKISMAQAQPVVTKAIRDAAAQKELSVYGGSMVLLLLAAKILPHRLLIAATACCNHMLQRQGEE